MTGDRSGTPGGDRPVTLDGERSVTLAAIVGAHGVTGEVRLKLFGEGPDSFRHFKSFDARGRTLTLKAIRPGPNGAVARFAEITDRNGAEALRGATLTVPRSTLPPLAEGEFYHCDLIDLPCVSTDGVPLGVVAAVENFGAGDIVEIQKADGKRFMVPIHAAEITEDRAIIDADFVE